MSFLPTDRQFWIRFRISLIVTLLMAGVGAVGWGAWSLGVVRRDELTNISKEQYTRRISVSARRGLITDRYGEELAVEVEVDSIYADPREVTEPLSAAKQLAPVLSVEQERLATRLGSRRHFVWLKRRVAPEISNKVKALKIAGVHILKESKRFYPSRGLAAHVVGFAGMDSKGLEGIERLFDEHLQGNQDAASGLADAHGNIVFSKGVFGANKVVGNNIVLTIDRNLQFEVEEELANTVRLFQAKAGQIVVMDPHTGDVLAMANWPSYNLNDISSSNPDKRRNRAVLDVFEPGSTMKVFTLAAALNSGVLRPDEKIFCEQGRMEFYDVVLHDDHRDGWLNPTQCLKRSSNICFAKIAGRMGGKRLYRYLRRFGFGESTNLQVPFEMRGLLQHYSEWSEFLTATVAFGQGIGVTGIQMATALSAIANGGMLMKPNLIKRVTDAEGEVILENTPTVRRRVVSRRTARLIADMMTAVTEEGGTGTEAALDGYLVAGKTGTAQKSTGAHGYKDKEKFVASFFGFVPADNPKLVISVVIDEPMVSYYGGTVAAPALRRIADKALRDMGVTPNFTVRRGQKKEEHATEKEPPPPKEALLQNTDVNESANMITPMEIPLQKGQVRTPKLLGMPIGKAISELNEFELRPLFYGTGIAAEQIPAPGEPINKGEYVQVNFSPNGEYEEEK
ncbi:MAG: PASTA domain-containing protein [Deltaproteobacteria bacterium]|nr:PASTA domain-containing protein [Deltaproteobacteria bacterium]MBN2673864.1 PASTA domain-containing protein [Deltaproteobacteria bacterium]